MTNTHRRRADSIPACGCRVERTGTGRVLFEIPCPAHDAWRRDPADRLPADVR